MCGSVVHRKLPGRFLRSCFHIRQKVSARYFGAIQAGAVSDSSSQCTTSRSLSRTVRAGQRMQLTVRTSQIGFRNSNTRCSLPVVATFTIPVNPVDAEILKVKGPHDLNLLVVGEPFPLAAHLRFKVKEYPSFKLYIPRDSSGVLSDCCSQRSKLCVAIFV
jgi:hypothetical protein